MSERFIPTANDSLDRKKTRIELEGMYCAAKAQTERLRVALVDHDTNDSDKRFVVVSAKFNGTLDRGTGFWISLEQNAKLVSVGESLGESTGRNDAFWKWAKQALVGDFQVDGERCYVRVK